jgi:hypothetical protein
MRRLFLVTGAALALAAPAAAAPAPAVPLFVQKLVKVRAGDLAYVPTRLPFRYRYRSYRYDRATRTLSYRFDDVRFAPTGRHTLVFTVTPFRGPFASCGEGRVKSLQMGGNKVYWNGTVAWRCQPTLGGRIARLAASGPSLPDAALGRVVASGKRIP